MNKELKPCPFCGGEVTADNIHFSHNNATYYLECPNCFVHFGANHKGDYGSPEEVVDEWNTRYQEE